MDFEQSLQRQLSERQRKKDGGVERIWSRKQIEAAFIESFELIGGVPRLAIWANSEENYGEFLKLLVKFAPKEQLQKQMGEVLEYRSMVPQSPLNRSAPPLEEIEEGEFVIEEGDQP